jgi:hypothetical protein
VTAVASTSRSPFRFADSRPPEPAATRPTPPNEIAPASTNRRVSRSSRTAQAIRAVKIGSEPMISAAVDAVVVLSAYTNETWFSQMPSAAASRSRGMSRRRTESDRSSPYVRPEKTSAAAA